MVNFYTECSKIGLNVPRKLTPDLPNSTTTAVHIALDPSHAQKPYTRPGSSSQGASGSSSYKNVKARAPFMSRLLIFVMLALDRRDCAGFRWLTESHLFIFCQ